MKVISEGKTFPSPLFILKAIKSQGISRFSVSVSKKVAKSAVERNKIRRRVYSSFRELEPQVKSGFWGVITVKSPIKDTIYKDILPSLTSLFVKSGLLK